jgi:hypothetical protein
LNRQINSYLADRPFKLIVRKNPEAAELSFISKQDKPIPDSFALILGDAIHNLHSALDIALFGMIGDKAKFPEKVSFPFAKRAESLDETIKNRQADLAGENVVRAIKFLKPYPTGNELLNGLHTLDITDKHKLIITVGLASDYIADDLHRIDRGFPISGGGVLRLAAGATITIQHRRKRGHALRSAIHGARTTEYEPQLQPVFQICFGDSDPFTGYPIIIKLHEMVAGVSKAVTDLVAAFIETDR